MKKVITRTVSCFALMGVLGGVTPASATKELFLGLLERQALIGAGHKAALRQLANDERDNAVFNGDHDTLTRWFKTMRNPAALEELLARLAENEGEQAGDGPAFNAPAQADGGDDNRNFDGEPFDGQAPLQDAEEAVPVVEAPVDVAPANDDEAEENVA